MPEAPDLAVALAAVRAVTSRFHTASDSELLADVELIEAIGRVVDGLRIRGAAEIEGRSGTRAGDQSLAVREGARDGVDLVQCVAGISRTAARQRVGLGAALAPAISLAGELLPGRYPALTDAVARGAVGFDSARTIVAAVRPLRRRVEPDQLDAMLDSLIDLAGHADTEAVRDSADGWALLLDPDGAEPTERNARRKRALRLGQTLKDGTTKLSVILLPEHLALLKELLESRRRGAPLFRTTAGGDDACEETDPEWREQEGPDGGEPRPRVQQDYDTFADLVTIAARAEHEGAVSPAVTHEVVVTVTAAELEARRGQGFTAGILAGIPIPTIERIACSGGTRLLVTGDGGEAMHLSHQHRLFTPAQRKALTSAAGGRCQYPGCRVPAPYLEAHHVQWWHRDGGETSVDNGIMLCSHHHHLIHEAHTTVEIRRGEDDLYIVPKSWRGPFRAHQRRQRGPTADPRLARLRRQHDPARNPFTT